MDGPGASGNKVFGRFTEPAHRVLDLARLADRGVVPAPRPSEGELLGSLGIDRHRQVIAHVGLPDGYHGAAGPLLAGLEVDLGRLREAVAAELRGSQR
jgi:hypothetical protein